MIVKKRWRKVGVILLTLTLLLSLLTACNSTDKYYYDSIGRVYGNMAIVARGWPRQHAVIDITSGEEIIPFGEYCFIDSIHSDMVSVVTDRQKSVIDITSGETIIPFGLYDNIHFLGDDYARVGLGRWMTNARVTNFESVGVINIASGEKIIPFGQFDSIGAFIYDGMIMVDNQKVIDLISGEVIFTLDHSRFHITHFRYGRISIGHCILMSYSILELPSGQEILSLRGLGLDLGRGGIRLRGDGVAEIIDFRHIGCSRIGSYNNLCCDGQCGTIGHVHGLMDIESGMEILPLKYFRIGYMSDGKVVVWNHPSFEWLELVTPEVGLIDMASGDMIISFGEYHDIRIYPNGFLALQREPNGLWWFESLESIKSTYSSN